VPVRLKLLAVILTMRFDENAMVHDVMSAVGSYAEMILARQRRISSLVVVHRPGEELSARPIHAHVLALARTHRPAGFSELHRSFQGQSEKLHSTFLDEWRGFRDAWDRVGRG